MTMFIHRTIPLKTLVIRIRSVRKGFGFTFATLFRIPVSDDQKRFTLRLSSPKLENTVKIRYAKWATTLTERRLLKLQLIVNVFQSTRACDYINPFVGQLGIPASEECNFLKPVMSTDSYPSLLRLANSNK